MSEGAVCHFNKFGFCKFGNQCFRQHENKLCENVNCKVLECRLRHPKKCRFFTEYYYCKFGSYCKFSHERFEEGKSIKLIEKPLEDVQKEIMRKDKEIENMNNEMSKLEKKIKSEISIITQKNEAMEKELKELREENKVTRSKLNSIEREVDDLKNRLKCVENSEDHKAVEDEIEADEPISNSRMSCEKCEFVAKSEAGLKTHITVNHKPFMKAFTRVSK